MPQKNYNVWKMLFFETLSKEYRGDVFVPQQFMWERFLLANSFLI